MQGRRKALAMLAVLASVDARGITRERMSALLWSESDEERARGSLKQLVHSLRQGLDLPDLFLPGPDLRLNPARVSSDVTDFGAAIGREDYEAAATVYAGPFLEGLHVRNADGFERWAEDERIRHIRAHEAALEHLAVEAERGGDARAALGWWRRLMDADPLSARAVAGVMRALEASGERAAALQHARRFAHVVQEELGSAPDPLVADLAARLRTESVEPADRAAKARGPSHAERIEPTLAVLPFANTSADPEDEHFSDGLTDELIGTIAKQGRIRVTGRTSAFAFKGSPTDLRSVAEALGVESVVEGSVRRSGRRLKIGVQLVRPSDGSVTWSEIYDRDAKDIFAVQEEIARAVAAALHVRLDTATPARARPATTSLVAHDLYLKGRFFQNRASPDQIRRAITHFKRAIDHDLGYAAAYTGLADAHLLLAIVDGRSPRRHLSAAHAGIARALALDPSLAEAHASLASVLFAFDWDWQGAGREFERAIELDAGYGRAHLRYGLYLMYRGSLSDAERVLENARALDPLAPSTSMSLGRLHLTDHREESAITLLRSAVELNPRLVLAHEQLGHALLLLGRRDEAVAAFREAARWSGEGGGPLLAQALAAGGDSDRAERLLRRAEQASGRRRPSAFSVATAYLGLGDRDSAYRWLMRACAQRDLFVHTIRAHRAYDALHHDPRWPEVLRRLGLAA